MSFLRGRRCTKGPRLLKRFQRKTESMAHQLLPYSLLDPREGLPALLPLPLPFLDLAVPFKLPASPPEPPEVPAAGFLRFFLSLFMLRWSSGTLGSSIAAFSVRDTVAGFGGVSRIGDDRTEAKQAILMEFATFLSSFDTHAGYLLQYYLYKTRRVGIWI